jgi:deazaflavin-dependent oxidoreductase (nitroreductase family)
MNAESQPRYVEPSRSTRIFNTAVGRLTRMGVSVYGSRVLAVRGRKSGEWRTTPVNPLTIDGQRYLVAPRGNTQWVRNMRVAGGGELRLGRRVEKFTAAELPVA